MCLLLLPAGSHGEPEVLDLAASSGLGRLQLKAGNLVKLADADSVYSTVQDCVDADFCLLRMQQRLPYPGVRKETSI